MRLIRCLLYGFVDNSGRRRKSFEVLTGDQELEVSTATYRPEIEQSEHAKSVSNIVKHNTIQFNAIQCNTIQYNAMLYNTLQYNTIHYNTLYEIKITIQ